MANQDRPFGFKVLRNGDSAHEYDLAAANSVIGKGDLIVRTSDGVVDRAAASATQIVGVALEPKAASSGGKILVMDDPEAVLVAQCDGGTGTLTAQTGQNLNANIVVADAVNGVSRMEIDESSGATTATLPLKVLRLHKTVDNEFGEFNRLEVRINNHVDKSTGVAGV